MIVYPRYNDNYVVICFGLLSHHDMIEIESCLLPTPLGNFTVSHYMLYMNYYCIL